jgi:LPXTG-motif cell wall-anchored protein
MTILLKKLPMERVMMQLTDENCFGCMNTACAKHVRKVSPETNSSAECNSAPENSSPAALAKEGLITTLPLALGFIAGFFITKLIFPQTGDAAWAAGGAAGIFLSGLAALLIRKHKREK